MATRLDYDLVNVFTLDGDAYSGNPLACFYRGEQHEALDQDQLQAIGAQFNLSEITFASLPTDEQRQATGATHVTRIFTPRKEHPFAGHPTIGTGAVLRARALIPERDLIQLCGVGPIKVEASQDGRHVSLSAPHKLISREPLALDSQLLGAALGLPPAAVTGAQAYVSSCGLPWLYVRLKRESNIVDLVHSQKGVADLVASLGERHGPVNGVDVFFAERSDGDAAVRVHCRVLTAFVEDAATGSAGVSLGPVLHALGLTNTAPSSSTTYIVSQGAEKGRPARLEGRLILSPEGEVAECLIGGEVLKVGEGWVAAPRRK